MNVPILAIPDDFEIFVKIFLKIDIYQKIS